MKLTRRTLTSLLAAIMLPSFAAFAADVEQWHPTDISLTSPTTYSNPFEGVSVSAKFTGPGGVTLTVPGFYDGSQTWKVRFSPTVQGNWSYTTTSSDSHLNGQTGTITCVANTNSAVHGALVIDSNHKHYFIYQDGTPCFMLSFEADWLGLMDFGDSNITKAKSLVSIYQSRGFNDVMMCIYAYDTSWEPGHTSSDDFGPPAEYPWLGSNSSPDHSQMNVSFFANMDAVIDYLFQNGITAHVFFKVNNKSVNWPTEGSTDEKLYFTYVTARYQAYPNMVWDFEKEGKNETGGNTYVNNSINTIKGLDGYHRLMTIHDDLSYYSAFPNTCDFQTIQADGTPLYSTLIGDRNAKDWPVFEGEYDYQIGNDGGHTYSVTDSQLKTLQDTLECLMAGSPANYYYTYHAWDVVRYTETPDGLNDYDNIVNLFKGTAWSSLAPNDGLINSAGVGRHCLAAPGSEYVAYLSGGGSVKVTISGAPSGNSLTATWVDMATGAQTTLANTGNGSPTFTNPWSDPALLHLKAGSGSGGGGPANGTYKIISRNSGLALGVSGGVTTSGSDTDQETYTAASSEQWTLTKLSSGAYEIIGVGSGKALDVAGASVTRGALLDIYPYHAAGNQQWIITPLSGGYFTVQGVQSGLLMDVIGAKTTPGTGIDQWTSNGGNNQQWSFLAP